MIGLDTNVLVRYLTQDDEHQASLAAKIIKAYSGKPAALFINNIVICELIWVLERGYKYTRQQIANAIKQVLSTKEFAFENLDDIWFALSEFERNGADFSDALIGETNKSKGCDTTYSFDKKATTINSFTSVETYTG